MRIPLRLKCSSQCGGLAASNGSSWWPPVVVGGGGGVSRVVGQSFERERREIVFFRLKNIFIICRSRLTSVSR